MELPERVALAAYFVVCESMTNVTRYSRAGSARVRVAVEDGTLCVEVSDDGIGGADPRAGTGLLGLADRMQIVGGSLDVVSPPGEGTRVTARIPLQLGRRWRSLSATCRRFATSRGASSAAARGSPSSWLQAGWTALSESEREEVAAARHEVARAAAEPVQAEARRLGRLAAKAAMRRPAAAV